MSRSEGKDFAPLWEDMPEDVLSRILCELDPDTRVAATHVCKRWQQCHDRLVTVVAPQLFISVRYPRVFTHLRTPVFATLASGRLAWLPLHRGASCACCISRSCFLHAGEAAITSFANYFLDHKNFDNDHVQVQAPFSKNAEECLRFLGSRFPNLEELHLTSQTPLVASLQRHSSHSRASSVSTSEASVVTNGHSIPKLRPTMNSCSRSSTADAQTPLELDSLTKVTWKGAEDLPLTSQLRHASAWLQWLPAVCSISSLDLSGVHTVASPQ